MNVQQIKDECKKVYDSSESKEELQNYIGGGLDYHNWVTLGSSFLAEEDRLDNAVPFTGIFEQGVISETISELLIKEWNNEKED